MALQIKNMQKSRASGIADKILSEVGAANASDAEKVLSVLTKPGLSDSERELVLSQLKGTSQEKLADARAYRMRVVETARANAEYLAKMLPQYKKRPELVLQKIYQDAIGEVMENVDEKIFIQPSISNKQDLRIWISKEPKKLEAEKEENPKK